MVQLAKTDKPRRGGRNQQLVLSAVARLLNFESASNNDWSVLSGGTDGEDGPTNAAGAVADSHPETAKGGSRNPSRNRRRFARRLCPC